MSYYLHITLTESHQKNKDDIITLSEHVYRVRFEVFFPHGVIDISLSAAHRRLTEDSRMTFFITTALKLNPRLVSARLVISSRDHFSGFMGSVTQKMGAVKFFACRNSIRA